ncbi:MAG: hypothetical protein A2157_04665 [Deltaproteobacteria bacterium RBG_16_47_11]|nr:MAG: hypothetical protein A2157_04665 [Deltaproteobacteria bacterium RBG_16_47_11]
MFPLTPTLSHQGRGRQLGYFLSNSLEIELISPLESPLAPLFQRGVIPPFGKGGQEGFTKGCRDNYETLNMSYPQVKNRY